MKKMIFFLAFGFIAFVGMIIATDSSKLQGYASNLGSMIGYGQAYTEKTVNAVQDSVRSSASAIDGMRDGQAKEIIEEQRKKIEEMKKKLDSSREKAAGNT